jgi:NAD(P)-dependent dehydrogenase (short-subunit alcohol dehydrogenase family)
VVSKTAVIRLTENLAAEVGAQGVRVFAMQPGTVRTAMAEVVLASPEGRTWVPWFHDTFAQGLDVGPEHAARLVLFLASGRADALSGRFLDVSDDIASLAAQSECIRRADQLTLRLQRPTPGAGGDRLEPRK